MGGAAGLAVGLKHLHLQPVARGDGGGTKAPRPLPITIRSGIAPLARGCKASDPRKGR